MSQRQRRLELPHYPVQLRPFPGLLLELLPQVFLQLPEPLQLTSELVKAPPQLLLPFELFIFVNLFP